MLLTSPFKAAFVLLMVSVSLHAAEVNLPQATIDKINEDFLDRYQINLDCSKGVAYPQIKFFAKGKNVFMLRDSNSSIGYSVAELKEAKAGEYYHEKGFRFFTGNIANTTDFFISSETLKKGEGELTVILYRDIYKCDAKLNTWSVERAIQDVQDEKGAEVEREAATAVADMMASKVISIMEKAIHKELTAHFLPPAGASDDVRVIYKLTASKQLKGKFNSVTAIELSQNLEFNTRAAEAFNSIHDLTGIKPDVAALDELDKVKQQFPVLQKNAGKAALEARLNDGFTFYIELNASQTFVPVPEKFRH